MKKIFITVLMCVTIFNCYGIDFKCKVSDTSLIKYRKTPGEGVENPYNEREIVVSTDDIIYGEPDYLLVKSNDKYYIDVSSLSLSKNQNLLNSIFSNKKWMPVYCCNGLYHKSYNYIFEHEGNIEALYKSGKVDYEIGMDKESLSSHDTIAAESNIKWYENLDIPFLEQEANISLKFNVYNDTLSFCYLYVTYIDDSRIDIYISTIYNAYNQNKDLNNLDENSVVSFNYKLDGDYLYLYKNNKCIYTFVAPSDSFLVQYKNFLKHKNYSINNIVWPCHADGSCDYGSKIKASSKTSGSR